MNDKAITIENLRILKVAVVLQIFFNYFYIYYKHISIDPLFFRNVEMAKISVINPAIK